MPIIKAEHNTYDGDNKVFNTNYFKTSSDQVDNRGIKLSELNFSEFLGVKLANDVVVNADIVNISMAIPYENMTTSNAYMQQIGDNIKILKAGYYLILAEVTISDTSNNKGFEVLIRSGEDIIGKGSAFQTWNIRARGSAVAINKLSVNQLVSLSLVRMYGGQQYRVAGLETTMRIYPLYVPGV